MLVIKSRIDIEYVGEHPAVPRPEKYMNKAICITAICPMCHKNYAKHIETGTNEYRNSEHDMITFEAACDACRLGHLPGSVWPADTVYEDPYAVAEYINKTNERDIPVAASGSSGITDTAMKDITDLVGDLSDY